MLTAANDTRSRFRPAPRHLARGESLLPDRAVAFILETAVVIAAKQRRSSVGAAFRAILATAEQFQTGERPPLNMFNRYSDLVRLAAVN